MSNRLLAVRRFLMFAIPTAAGAAILAGLIAGRAEPERQHVAERATPVRVIAVPRVMLVSRAIGYGNVIPSESWTAIARVGGEVVEISPNLQTGLIVPKGTRLLKINPIDYELAVVRAEAALHSTEADLVKLDQSEANARALLAIEERSLNLASEDYKRKVALQKKGTISQSALDDAERALNQQRSKVRELSNEIALLPSQRRVAAALRDQRNAELEQAHLDLERTEIVTPFAGRIAEETVAVGQYIAAGQAVVTVDGIAAAEVSTQLTVDQALPLFDPNKIPDMSRLDADTVREMLSSAGLTATVRFTSGRTTFTWPARLSRVENALDPTARTVGFVFRVDRPYRGLKPGKRPPLTRNMFVEVEVVGNTRPGALVVPRTAIRKGHVMIADADNRLARRRVDIVYRQGPLVAVNGGIAEGERVIVSDPVPAIDGMLLDISEDVHGRDALIATATGEGPVQ